MVGLCDICGEEHELDLNGWMMMIGKLPDAEEFARLHGMTLHDPLDLPRINVHIPGTPDVPDLVRPGDWLVESDYMDVYSVVVKLIPTREGKWDSVPGAKSWQIVHIGIGYMDGRNVSENDCCYLSHIVAVNGQLLPLYKDRGGKPRTVRVCEKPAHLPEITKSILSLIKRLNGKVKKQNEPQQLSLFQVTP